MSHAWLVETWRGVAVAAVALVAGLATGHGLAALALAVAGYLAWHLHQLYRLERWLRDGRRYQPPDADGIWGEVFHHYYRLQKRNRARKRRLAALVHAFRDSTAAIPDGAVSLGPSWRIQWFNNAAARMLGLGPGDVGQRVANLVRAPAFVDYLEAGDFRVPVALPAPDDDAMMLSLHVVRYGERQHLLVVRDVTRLHRLEQMRRDFVANASHELRSPLTVVCGYLDALVDDPATAGDELGRVLDRMREQTTRMQDIVDDLLELSRLENDPGDAPREPVDVRALVDAACATALALRKPGQTLSCDVTSDARLLGAEKELRSVLDNLVGNALAYTQEGGTVTVRYRADAAGACLTVTDNGAGIPAEHLPRLTERFYRVDRGRARKTGGTGLGLSIVKHVLQRHGAHLEVESTVGAGSTFTAVFPRDRVTDAS